MAHAKTSLPQIFAQLSIGVGLIAVCYKTLLPEKAEKSVHPTITTPSSEVQALEAEIRENTSGKVWGLPGTARETRSDSSSSKT